MLGSAGMALVFVAGTACASVGGSQPTPAPTAAPKPTAAPASQPAAAASAVAVASPATAASPAAATGTGGTIRLGLILPLSGPNASLGNETAAGIDTALELVNASGGVNGQKVEFVRADAPDPTAASNEAERLSTAEKVKLIVGTQASALSVAASAVANRNKVTYWEVQAVADEITQRGFPYLFRSTLNASALGVASVDFAAQKVAPILKADPKSLKIAIVHEDGSYGTSVSAGAEKHAKELGLNVVTNEAYSATSKDLSPLVLKLRSLAPDIIIATSNTNDAILLHNQMKELGLYVKAFIGDGAGHINGDYLKAVGKEINGVVSSDATVSSLTVPQGALNASGQAMLKQYLDQFRKKYGRDPGPNADVGFSGAWMLLHDVLPKAKSLEPEDFKAAAMAVEIPLGTEINGQGLKFDQTGQNTRAAAIVEQWQGEKLITLFPDAFAQGAQPILLPLPQWADRGK